MKNWKRVTAFVLTVCMVLSMLPPVQIAHAAQTIQRYELDTDGVIDVGATYLIVNAGTAGSGNALKFYYSSNYNRDLRNQTVTIKKENDVTYIETGFANETDCQFQFTGANAGSVKHGDYYLDLGNSRYDSGSSGVTLTFNHVGNGQYQISYSIGYIFWNITYYLCYNNNDWKGETTPAYVYLYKLVDHVVSYDVTFDGNGATSGTLPENRTGLSSGATITAPSADLRKDVGEDTWLFLCWNTEKDGSGTEYAPNETITVTKDITLYAQWIQQTKYSVSMITYLDRVVTDIDQIAGYDKQFYARLEDSENTDDTTGENTDDTTGENTDDTTGENTDDTTGENTDDTTGENTDDTTGENTDDTTGENTDDTTGENTDDTTGENTDDTTGENTDDTTGENTDDTTGENTDDTTGESADDSDADYIPLTRREEGVYSAKVVEDGTYVIYTKNAEGGYEPVHGHTVVIYGQDGTTDCFNYSVTYNTAGGTWAEGEAPAAEVYHYGETVTAVTNTPTLAGNRFLGWKDEKGTLYAPGQRITGSIDKPITLTAVWETTITVTVNVVIKHDAGSAGFDNVDTKSDVSFTLLREKNGVNLPVQVKNLTKADGQYNSETKTTTYTVVFADMPQGIYHVAGTKSNYETTFSYQAEPAVYKDQTIGVELQYKPDNFDLTFDVVVNAENDVEKALMPQAVNVKVTYWGYNAENELGWHVITQQAGTTAPTTVYIDQETGKGTGSFPVWRYWSGSNYAYEYRVEVTSYILPDGTLVPATSKDYVTYTMDGSGLYEAKVSVDENGRKPAYPEDSNAADIVEKNTLTGAYYDGEKQVGKLTVTVDITSYTVTFDPGEGNTVNDKQIITLTGQYRYPALYDYVAVPEDESLRFICWLVDGQPATDMAGQLLNGNVTYKARYNENITLSGTVEVDGSYQQDGNIVDIHGVDRAAAVRVVLQKKVGDAYNDIQSVSVPLTYVEGDGKFTVGTGTYSFANLPNDGTEYRVYLMVHNYTVEYKNHADEYYTATEGVVKMVNELATEAHVNVHLTFTPDQYQQAIRVDASQIHADLRPTGVLTQILYRDLGDVHNYQVISQHVVEPYGVKVELVSNATGLGFDDVWNWHTNGALYEYQVQVSTVYGKVTGAYTTEGTEYTAASPFTVVYGRPNNYLQQTLEGGVMLEATLVPKQYAVKLDLNLGEDTTPVVGLEEYMVDDGSGNESYMFLHTWSYAEQFTAYPYREGYVFLGWEVQGAEGTGSNQDDVYIQDGVIHVGNTLAKEVTLKATWKKMNDTDYTVRYLELNTDKVLKGATMVEGAGLGSTVAAAERADTIEGYVYAGALVNGIYVDKTDNPVMTVTNDPKQNLMIIYYLPDGSDGYTEQVESNLEINKTAVLEDNGTYTITLDTWTKDNPITTLIQQNTPLDIVLVLDQSGSLAANDFAYLEALQEAVGNFVESVADHGRRNEVDHRIAMVGYAYLHFTAVLNDGGEDAQSRRNGCSISAVTVRNLTRNTHVTDSFRYFGTIFASLQRLF